MKVNKLYYSDNNRIQFIDIAKGIAILFIVLGHCGVTEAYNSAFITKFLYACDMPLFFIIGGYLYKDTSTKLFIRKKAKGLILPYVIMFIIAFGAWATFGRILLNDINSSRTVFKIILKNFLYGTGIVANESWGSVGVLWFLPCYFISNIIFFVLMKIIKKLQYLFEDNIDFIGLIIISASSFIGYIISKKIFLPWSIDVALFVQILLYFGYLFKKYDLISKIVQSKYYKIIMFSIVIILLYGSYKFDILAFNNREWHNSIYSVIVSLCGAIFILIISFNLCNYKFASKLLGYFGSISLIILCLHSQDTSYFHWNLIPELSFIYNSTIYLFIFRLIFSVILCELFRRTPILKKAFFK